ncbi:MAG: Fic family protein [Clostridiales bacterium]|nr:Fic family protein [Clostridiales bacterium]
MNFEQIVAQWKKEQRNTASDYRVLLDNFRIIFAYHSGKIENEEITLHDTREIFENGRVINYTGDLRNLFEIQNQKDCFDFLLECVALKQELTVELICDLHRRLMTGCYDQIRYEKGERPGKFKIHDYVTGDGVGAAPEDVETEMKELLEEVKEEEGRDVMTIAAYFHLRFEEIHPFADGNGRLGRTLLNYYLLTHDYPPLVLFEEDKKTYYMALTVFDKTGKIDGFLAFLREQMVKTWERKKRPAVKLNMLL